MKTKKNISKNRKKGWRKNVDVEEVEEFVDDVRLQERTGGLVAEKKDEELFVIDKTSEKPKKIKKKEKNTSELKCYRALVNTSKIDVPIQTNKVNPPLWQKVKPKITKKERKRNQNGKVSIYDLWDDSKVEEEVDDETIVKHFKRTTNTEPINVPCHRYQKPSLLDAVEVPHAGASYNPAFDAHQELLNKANDTEIKKEKEKLKLKRALEDKFPKAKDAPNAKTWMTEMCQGLGLNENSGSEDETEDVDLFNKNPPVRGDQRKVKSKRNKEKELKIKKIKKNKDKLKVKAEGEIYRLRQIKKEIKKGEDFTQKKQLKRIDSKAEKLYKPSRKGSLRYEDPDMEVALTDELSGSLRLMKTEGDLLEDRYKSMQRRNILLTTKRQKVKRKYKLKKYTKRTHRDTNVS